MKRLNWIIVQKGTKGPENGSELMTKRWKGSRVVKVSSEKLYQTTVKKLKQVQNGAKLIKKVTKDNK